MRSTAGAMGTTKIKTIRTKNNSRVTAANSFLLTATESYLLLYPNVKLLNPLKIYDDLLQKKRKGFALRTGRRGGIQNAAVEVTYPMTFCC